MATKGASNRYGNSNGSRHQGKPTGTINYPWAKAFNKYSLDKHFDFHGKHMGFDSIESYKQHAIKFANTIDKKNCLSFVDAKTGATYKYNIVTNEFAIITKDGYIVTYYKPENGYDYYKEQIMKHGKVIGGKKYGKDKKD